MTIKGETAERIRAAYRELVTEKRTANIPIREICQSAGISRKTFYHYYEDRFDLLRAIIYEEIEQPLKLCLNSGFAYEDIFKIMFANFLMRKKFYVIAFRDEDGSSIYDTLAQRLVSIISLYPKAGFTEEEKAYIDRKFAVDIVQTVRDWVLHDMTIPPDRMARILMYH